MTEAAQGLNTGPIGRDAMGEIYRRMRWIRSVCDLPETVFSRQTGPVTGRDAALFGSEAALGVLGVQMTQADLICADQWHPALPLAIGAPPRTVLEVMADGPLAEPRREELKRLVDGPLSAGPADDTGPAGDTLATLTASHGAPVRLGHMVGTALAHRQSSVKPGLALIFVPHISIVDGALWEAFIAAVDLRLPIVFVTVSCAPMETGLAPPERLATSAGLRAASARAHNVPALHKTSGALLSAVRDGAGPALLDLAVLGRDALAAFRSAEEGEEGLGPAALDGIDRSIADALDHMLGRYRVRTAPGVDPGAGLGGLTP